MEKLSHLPFIVEHAPGSGRLWREVGQRVCNIHRVSFADVIFRPRDVHDAQENLHTEFINHQANVFLLKDHGSIVGFTVTYPCFDKNEFMEQEMKGLGINMRDYFRMQEESIELGWTAIAPAYRGRGGWSLLMQTLEDKARDASSFMVRYVRRAHGYSDKVKSRYAKNIVFASDYLNPDLGPQVYLRTSFPSVRD